jgi:hypothetical protein
MAESVSRSRGRPSNYKQDRGGVPAEFGPFIGIVKSNVDPTRAGRLQVFIAAFVDGGQAAEDDDTKWTTVSYMQQFGGYTPAPVSSGDNKEVGAYPGNQNSYGMWFTPPDLGVEVLCVFVNGDRTQGYYIGTVPAQGLGSMLPGVAASTKYNIGNNANQAAYFADATRLPVTEINTNNQAIFNNPQFFNQPKPVHSYVAGALFQQGLIEDIERGTIRSSSQRETPSAVYGVSTPGMPVYQGGIKPNDIRQKINDGSIKPNQAQVIGRVGGHSLVMDDGDLEGDNALFRLRTSKGHQITMSDTGNFFYIVHANGQTWLEFGVEGTVDVYATNSVNVRTKGDINLHAGRDISMYAGGNIKMKSNEAIHAEATTTMTLTSQGEFTAYSKSTIGVKADGVLTINSSSGSWGAGSALVLQAGGIDLNGPAAGKVASPNPITKTLMDDTEFDSSKGWQVKKDGLESIVNRAPTHEPYPYHNKGVDVKVEFEDGKPSPPPGSQPVPAGVEIVAK